MLRGGEFGHKVKIHNMKLVLPLVFLMSADGALAAELKPKTLAAYEKYRQRTEARNDEFRASSRFLWADRLPEAKRAAVLEHLRKGGVPIEPLRTPDANGREIEIPDGLVHHWVGAVFVPGVSLQQAIGLVQDYDAHQNTYAPAVMRSKLVRRTGDEFEVFLRFFKKKVLTVILNTTHVARYWQVDAFRVYARSNMTKAAEVADSDHPDGPEKPPGEDHGFLWRLFSEWRFEQRDGGVYIESESVTLTRDIPIGLGFLVGPFVKSLPRETLLHTMESTRRALPGARASVK
jgi:hypothetical protein